MSFLRAGQRKKRVIVRKKPNWDDSLSDLSVFKPTQQELAVRHAAHKSKNHMAVKLEKMRRAKQKSGHITQAEKHQMAIMKEVLYDQEQLHDTLSRSDKMMAIVKDLFGDDPKRFMGFPNVTTVPGSEVEQVNRNGTIVAPVPDIRTRTETLSESVMDQVALNDLTDSESDEDGNEQERVSYQPQMNLKRFQQFLAQEEERNQTLSSIGGQAQLSHTEAGPIQSTRLQISQDTGCETPRRDHNESLEILRTPRSAINDTRKVKKTKKRVSPQKENRPQPPSALNLTDLRKVLGNLENEIEQYEKQTGRRPPAEKQRSETFSGYTVALVDSVSKLATYLRETDLRLQAEMTVREQLTQDVFQLRNIVDTLTSDIIVTQEEYSSVLTEFQRYRADTTAEINNLKLALQGKKPLLPGQSISPHREESSAPQRSHIPPPPYQNRMQSTQQAEPVPSHPSVPDHVSSSHAVVLSPPVRKTRLTEEPEQVQQKRQTSLIDLSTLSEPHHPNVPTHLSQQYTSISVPRPMPLVQSNIPGGSLSDETERQSHPRISQSIPSHSSQQMSMPSQQMTMPSQQMQTQTAQMPMSEQIAELNRQHEEAQKRLQLLFQQQERQHLQLVQQQHQKFQQNIPQTQSQLPQQRQQQGLQQNTLYQQQQHGHQQNTLYQQQQHGHQQNTLYQQQQHGHQQNTLYQQQQQQQQFADMEMQNRQYAADVSDPRSAMPSFRPGLEQGVHGLDSRDIPQPTIHHAASPPAFNQAQSRLQGTISPPISPISIRSDNMSVLQQLHGRQKQYAGRAGREITVSLPVMDLETSAGSLPSPKAISPAH